MNTRFVCLSFILLLLGASCRSPQTTSTSLKEGATLANRFDAESFFWFMELIQEEVDLPSDLIQAHTLIAKPYGKYAGMELREVNPFIQAFILEQRSALCTNYFLLTTDGTQVIDQRMIAEVCDWGPASDQRIYTQYDFVDADEVLIQTIEEREEESGVESLMQDAYVYQISGAGRIERCVTTH